MKIKLSNGAMMPTRAHETDAGLDLYTPADVVIPAYSYRTIDTGVSMEIPKGYYGKVASKSGLMIKGLTCRGTIDSSYRGTIKVVMFNHTHTDYEFHKGEKVTQLIIEPCITPELELLDELDETERGENGFGSSGR